jgi:hypothetical protein
MPPRPKRRFNRQDFHRVTSFDSVFFRRSPETEAISIKRLSRLEAFKQRVFPAHQLNLSPEEKIERATRFRSQTRELKKKINSTPEQRQAARRKIVSLFKAKNMVIRLDNLARVLRELGTSDAFSGTESAMRLDAAIWNGGQNQLPAAAFRSFRKNANLSPEELVENFFRGAHDTTQWGGNAKYNSVTFFDPEVFTPNRNIGDVDGYMNWRWGRVNDIGRHPILAFQVIDADPKALLAATRSMLKRRRNDPVAVFDIYGRLFYP